MELSRERIQEMKDLLEKEHGREFTWEEASDAAYRLTGLANLLFDAWREDERRKKKLEESPKGFRLDGVGYTCFICGDSTRAGENWYDKYGIKCTTCQKAVDRKEIPASLAKNKESWYSEFDLRSRFNLKGPTLRSWVKKGILKPRTITFDGKRVHAQLFLIKDNKDTLPPKKMVESQSVKETKDGKEWFRVEPWYRFVDPHEHLRGYKIMDYLKVIHGEDAEPKE
jgi:DNA-directed RNA polymerase subunit RPC12/RpoP